MNTLDRPINLDGLSKREKVKVMAILLDIYAADNDRQFKRAIKRLKCWGDKADFYVNVIAY